jgi:asparagine synthase (glutamine-hydrolysing)
MGLNYEALAVFMRLGFFLGDTTAWTDRRAAPPPGMNDAARMTLWDPAEPAERAVYRSRSELVDTYVELFRQAVGRLLPDEPFVLPLSGGADSRHILLELAHQGCPPRFTVTAAHNDFGFVRDVASARAISRHLSIPHKTVSGRLSYPGELDKNERTDFQADEHGWVPPLARALQEVTKESFDGIGGDVLSAGLNLSPERLRLADKPELLAEDLMGDEEMLSRALAPDFYELIPRHVAKAAIVAEYERWRHEPDPIDAFSFRNRTRREIALAPFTLMQPIVMHTPYLDPDLAAFLRTIPAGETVDHMLHREVIARAFPAARSVPFAKQLSSSRLEQLWRGSRKRASMMRVAWLASKSPRLSRPGALSVLGSGWVPHVFAERLAWIAQLPDSPPQEP